MHARRQRGSVRVRACRCHAQGWCAASRESGSGTVVMQRGGKVGRRRPLIADDGGFTSVGTAIAVLLVVSLLMTSAQVYWLNSNSADIQFAADAAALSAENAVAEYLVCVQVADGIVLSFSLLGSGLLGVGAVASCIPYADLLAPTIISAGRTVLQMRDTFAREAVEALETLQKGLPFLCAMNASLVTQANAGSSSVDAGYLALALPVPLEGDAFDIPDDPAADSLASTVEEAQPEVSSASSQAEDARREADAAKLEGFLADCGEDPSMRERASTLAGLSGSSNPAYHSVDDWGFEVPIQRAKAYYHARIVQEHPASGDIDEVTRSAARARFYRYAYDRVSTNHVSTDAAGTKTATMVLLPHNTAEVRETELYSEAVWPVSVEDGMPTLHASAACPGCHGVSGQGSVQQVEEGQVAECPVCHFDVVTLGRVPAASTSIDNGFEHHYRRVAEAAARYSEAVRVYEDQVSTVKGRTSVSFERFADALRELGGTRITARPPGRFGCVAIVVDARAHEAPPGLRGFLADSARIGPRVAVSSAALAPDSPEKGANVISSLLSRLSDDAGSVPGSGLLHRAVVVWGDLLLAYCEGTERAISGIGGFMDAVPLIGGDELSGWAERRLRETLELVGLQPADMTSYKPVTVNTAHVMGADTGGVGARLISVKQAYLSTGGDTTLFGGLARLLHDEVSGRLEARYTIAHISLFDGLYEQDIEVSLPDSVVSRVDDAFGRFEDAASSVGNGQEGEIWR